MLGKRSSSLDCNALWSTGRETVFACQMRSRHFRCFYSTSEGRMVVCIYHIQKFGIAIWRWSKSDCGFISYFSRIAITYDHRLRSTGHPVRSAIHKPQIGRLVVGWVTTSEYLLLYVFILFFRRFAVPSSPTQFFEVLGQGMKVCFRLPVFFAYFHKNNTLFSECW